jgi:predicted alpha/beta superfamily hydrolase
MYSLLYDPGLFQARFCFSTPFWRQNNILISKVEAFTVAHDTLQSFLFLSAGSNETDNIKNGLTKLTEVLGRRAPSGFVWRADITPDANHQNNVRLSSSAGLGKWCEYVRDSATNDTNQ